MNVDYKPKAVKSKSLILKRTVHVSLGFLGFMCIVLALSAGKPAPVTQTTSIALPTPTLAIATPTAIEAPKTNNKAPLVAALEKEVIKQQLEKAPAPTSEWKTVKIHPGDTLSKVFTRLGISTKDVHEILTAHPAARKLRSLHPGQTLKVQAGQDQQLAALVFDVAPGSTLNITRNQKGFSVENKVTPLEKQLAFGKGEIHNSLFSSGKRAGLDQNILAQMVEIFGWNIDFALDLQPNDTFRVLYEEKCLEGERIQTGHILAAEIINDGTKYQAVRYTDKMGKTGYFSPDGYGMHQAFLRTPVNFTRISSHFGSRKHPMLHQMRHHKGVDYSAPKGTPVQATGDGKVLFAGRRSGYGNVVELQHGSRYSTLYAHLSKFPKGMRAGVEVKQGEVIGFVGSTGLATGDHLHYEFRVDGIHRDPLTVALPKKNPITERNKHHFIAHAKEMMRLLDLHEHKINVARYP